MAARRKTANRTIAIHLVDPAEPEVLRRHVGAPIGEMIKTILVDLLPDERDAVRAVVKELIKQRKSK